MIIKSFSGSEKIRNWFLVKEWQMFSLQKNLSTKKKNCEQMRNVRSFPSHTILQ